MLPFVFISTSATCSRFQKIFIRVGEPLIIIVPRFVFLMHVLYVALPRRELILFVLQFHPHHRLL